MARKVGEIIRRGTRTWLVRVYCGRDVETTTRKYLNQTIHGGLRDAQAHLNKMLGERDRGRRLDSSKQTLNQYLDRWLELCVKPRLRAKSLKDYEGLLRRYVRPGLGTKTLASISPFDIQTLYGDLLIRSLSARSILYTHAVLRSALKQAMRWTLRRQSQWSNTTGWQDIEKRRAEFRIAVMEKLAKAPKAPGTLVGGIASHLEHPCGGRMSGHAGKGDASRFQMDEEQDVVGGKTSPGQHLNGEEVGACQDGEVGAMKSLQVVVWLRFGAVGIPCLRRMLRTV
jgi:hypothetical protein